MTIKDLVTSIMLPIAAGLLTVIEFAIACFPNLSQANFRVEPVKVEPDFYR
jgi:hypothetical protein